MEDLQTESRYLKLCYEFRVFLRFMKAAFYISDFWKFRWSKDSTKDFISKRAAKLLKHSAELLKTLGSAEGLKGSAKCLKSSAACLCYNTAHAVPTSRDIIWIKYLSQEK